MNVAELAATLGWEIDFDTIARYQSQLNKARENTERLDDETRKLAQTTKLLTELRGDPGKALAMISPGVPGGGAAAAGAAGAGKAEGATRGWGRALEIANAGLGTALKGYAIVSSVVGKVRGAFESAAREAGHYNDTAARLGLSVEIVQELGYAAEQSGSDLDTLAGGMGKLANVTDAAKKGSKDAAASLRAVGVSAADLRSGKMSLDGALAGIADKFAAMPDGARKAALATDLFGGAGAKLIPLLNKGSAGIGALRSEAQRLGVVMSGETTEGLSALGDQQAKLGAQLAGIRNQVMAALLPMLTELAAGLSAWLDDNREKIVEVLSAIGTGIVYLARGISLVVRGIAAAVEWIIDNWEPLAAVLAAVMWPLTLTAAIVAGLILAWPYVKKAAIAAASAIVAAFKAVGRAIASVWDDIKGIGRAIGRFFEQIGSAIKSVFQSAVNTVIDGINFVTSKLDWIIRKANKIPGVNIGTLGSIDHVGGDKPTEATLPFGFKPYEPSTTSGRGGTTVNNSIGAINVTSPAADPAQVAVHVRREVADAMNSMLLEADAGVA